MVALVWERRVLRFRYSILGAALLASACGGKSETIDSAPNTTGATGGSGSPTAGSTSTTSTGGTTTNDGGSAGVVTPSGGTGDTGTGGSGPLPNCDKVSCEPIPTSCKVIVQLPGECCPTCPDTGCGACPDLTCDDGTHAETVGGDCCPSCVTDPPDPCVVGQKTYAELHQQILEKYNSRGCNNSNDCALVTEDNACTFACNVALEAEEAGNFLTNLSNAASDCATCPAIPPAHCEHQNPACVNGKCVGASSGL